MEDYSAKIIESSSELTARERIALKDIRNAISLDAEVNPGDSLVITPDKFAIISVHNERAKGDKDYTKYVLVDTAGNKYFTGSESFYRSFRQIWDEMKADAPDESFSIECYKVESKNYAGKYFISCSIAP